MAEPLSPDCTFDTKPSPFLTPSTPSFASVVPHQQPSHSITLLVLNPLLPDLLQNNEKFFRIHPISEIKRLHVAGQVFAENDFFQRSARWMKTNIRTIHNALDTLLVVNGKAFTFLNDTTTHYGFIAQGLKDVTNDTDTVKRTRPISAFTETVRRLAENVPQDAHNV